MVLYPKIDAESLRDGQADLNRADDAERPPPRCGRCPRSKRGLSQWSSALRLADGGNMRAADEPAQLLRLIDCSRIPITAAGTQREMLVDPESGNGFPFPVDPCRQRLASDVTVHVLIVAYACHIVPARAA